MDSNKIFVTVDGGEEKEMEILFTFESDEYGKQYVVFCDPEVEDGEVYAMAYDDDGNLDPVENEDEWAMIQEVLEVYSDGDFED